MARYCHSCQNPEESEHHRESDRRCTAGAGPRRVADLDRRRGRLHPDGHAADHPRRCGPGRRRSVRAQSGHPGRLRVHPGGGVLPSADPGWIDGGPFRATSDARRQRGTARLRADPSGARDDHARRRCGASSGRDRRCGRLRGDLGAHPTMVFSTTGAVDDPADNNRRSTGADSVCGPVRRIAPPQRMVDRIHQRRRRQCADGRAGIRRRAQRSARILGADSHRVGPRRRHRTQRGVGTPGDTSGLLRSHGHAVPDDGVRAAVGIALSGFRPAPFGIDRQLAHHGVRAELGCHRTGDRRAHRTPHLA